MNRRSVKSSFQRMSCMFFLVVSLDRPICSVLQTNLLSGKNLETFQPEPVSYSHNNDHPDKLRQELASNTCKGGTVWGGRPGCETKAAPITMRLFFFFLLLHLWSFHFHIFPSLYFGSACKSADPGWWWSFWASAHHRACCFHHPACDVNVAPYSSFSKEILSPFSQSFASALCDLQRVSFKPYLCLAHLAHTHLIQEFFSSPITICLPILN